MKTRSRRSRMSHTSRRLVGALVTGLAGLAAALAIGSPANAAGTSYVALGDSYSSGVGTRSYISDGTSCYRSVYAYPVLDASALGLSLTFRACSGAKVADVTNTQLSALTSTTAYVTISVGGNDAGFADVLTTCAQPAWLSNCYGAIDTAQSVINNTLPGRLATLYTAIKGKAPTAKVIVVGYPRIFNGEDCNALTWFSPTEESRLNATADLLNSKTRTAALNAGYTFADPTSRFIGHAVCDDVEWINGLSSPIIESYHPNKSGQASGYVPVTKPAFGVTTALSPARATARAESLAPSLARDAQRYAAADRTIEPTSFVAPDLTTPEARAAAAAAGVDLSSRESIDRVDRIASAEQDAAWVASRR